MLDTGILSSCEEDCLELLESRGYRCGQECSRLRSDSKCKGSGRGTSSVCGTERALLLEGGERG